jgi:hypothetical protein
VLSGAADAAAADFEVEEHPAIGIMTAKIAVTTNPNLPMVPLVSNRRLVSFCPVGLPPRLRPPHSFRSCRPGQAQHTHRKQHGDRCNRQQNFSQDLHGYPLPWGLSA